MKTNFGIPLTRSEMKDLKGGYLPAGDPCTYTWQDSGGWHTESGTCHVAVTMSGYSTTYTPYCNTGSHTGPTVLTSNGGVSRCGPSFTA